MDWQKLKLSPNGTTFLSENKPVLGPFVKALPFHAPGLAPVADSNGWYHIAADGTPLYSDRYLKAFGYYFLRAAVLTPNGWFHLTEKGAPAYPQYYLWIGNYQQAVCAVCDFEARYFHVSPNGTPLYPEKYQYAGDFYENVACVCLTDGRWTHINFEGKFIHDSFFMELGVFHKGYAAARDKTGWFHIDKKGLPLYKERYAALEPFYNGRAFVKTFEDVLGYIDETGALLHHFKHK